MKRFHVHVAVDDLAKSTRFYSAMFGAEPSVQKEDYAKWMLEDPRVNFAISSRSNTAGINHLGFQAETPDELEEIHSRLQAADMSVVAEEATACCYAKSDKYWVQDPSGIAWESFRSLETIPFFGEAPSAPDLEGGASIKSANACCPAPAKAAMPTTSSSPAKGCCNG
jgi:catechol 2,3-dioxygenase-like lactoylglutathione lyase family enzyme